MPRQPMNPDDPLVPKQISLPLSMKKALKEEAQKTGKSESEIIREALRERLGVKNAAD